MKHFRAYQLLLFVCLPFLIFSCLPQGKIISTKKKLSQQDSLLQQYDQQLSSLDKKRKSKEESNLVDDTANIRMKKFIDKTKEEIGQFHKENTILIGDVEVNKEDWDRLRKNLSACLNATKRINGKILFLTDLINRNTVLRLDQDVIFEPGKYTVAAPLIAAIGRIFEPVAMQIDSFTRKYPDFPLSLAITAKGYADATDISEGSSLYKEIADDVKFTGQPLTRENLNKSLSNKRAKTVIELFENYTKAKSSIGGIIFIYKGKGEEFPDPTVIDYKQDDPRRRVVLLYWSVFPDY